MSDLMSLASQSKGWVGAASALTQGMGQLGADNETARRAVAGLQVFTGVAQMASVASAAVSMMRTVTTAEASAETAVKTAAGPPGWAMIALALGTAAIVGGTVYAIAQQYNMHVNMDNPSEAKLAGSIAGRIA